MHKLITHLDRSLRLKLQTRYGRSTKPSTAEIQDGRSPTNSRLKPLQHFQLQILLASPYYFLNILWRFYLILIRLFLFLKKIMRVGDDYLWYKLLFCWGVPWRVCHFIPRKREFFWNQKFYTLCSFFHWNLYLTVAFRTYCGFQILFEEFDTIG